MKHILLWNMIFSLILYSSLLIEHKNIWKGWWGVIWRTPSISHKNLAFFKIRIRWTRIPFFTWYFWHHIFIVCSSHIFPLIWFTITAFNTIYIIILIIDWRYWNCIYSFSFFICQGEQNYSLTPSTSPRMISVICFCTFLT